MDDLISREMVNAILDAEGASDAWGLASVIKAAVAALPSALAATQKIENLLSDVSSYHPNCNTFNPKTPE